MPKKIVYLPSEMRDIGRFLDLSSSSSKAQRGSQRGGGGGGGPSGRGGGGGKTGAPPTKRDKNHETFEEGYAYELRESAKLNAVVQRAASDLRTTNAAAAAAAVAAAATAIPPPKEPSDFRNEFAMELAAPALSGSSGPKHSRFSFDDVGEDAAPGQSSQRQADVKSSIDIARNVVWNNNSPYQATSVKSSPAVQQQPPAQAPPPPLQQQAQKRAPPPAPAAPTQPKAQVWDASDLEAQFLAEARAPRPAPKKQQPPPPQQPPQPKVWDAAALEAELLRGTPAAAANSYSQQYRGGGRGGGGGGGGRGGNRR